MADKRQVEDSKTIRARVQAARERQLARFKGTKLTCNAEMGATEVRDFCQNSLVITRFVELRAFNSMFGTGTDVPHLLFEREARVYSESAERGTSWLICLKGLHYPM